MAALAIKPNKADLSIAREISCHAHPAAEEAAQALTWGADEKLLLALAAGFWLTTRKTSLPLRRASHHALLVTAAASLLPHLMKLGFNQVRPDRLTIEGHLRGIPLSGKARDAFPSGHALHMGALASAACAFPRGWREATIGIAALLSFTRIAVLAHWTSDVVTGFALGALTERALRALTRYLQGLPFDKARKLP